MSANKVIVGETEIVLGPNAGKLPWARIVTVNRFYWPDHAATSQILTDLVRFLAAQGWCVSVVTSAMRYDAPEERLAPREVKHGVRIRRVWTSRMGRDWLPGRALDYLTFYLSAGAALLAETRRGDLILVTTDPPLFVVVAAAVARLKGARLVTWNHDVFPEVAQALGLSWAGGRLGRFMRWLRNRALRRAAVNVAISDDMGQRLKEAGVKVAGLRVVPNWSDAGIRPVAPEENWLRRDWGLEDAFVIGYSGNLGRAHMPDKVAELVRSTRDLPGLAWLFIGGGAGMDRIRALVEATGAANVQFRPYQHRQDLAHSLSVPDLHLVALDPACEGLIVPAKISGILAAGRPVLYLGDPESALGRDLRERGIGVCLDPAAPETWREEIIALLDAAERLREMGHRARARSENYPPSQALLNWESVLLEAAAVPRVELG